MSEGEVLRAGIVGVGRHATTAILPALPTAGFRVVAACANHRDHAAAAARRFGATDVYDDLAQMLERSELDAVVAVVPPDQFAAVVRRCLVHRIPVFAEKPGAGDAAEAEDLAAQASDCGVPVMVGYMKRFAAAYQQARAIATADTFGPPTLGSFTWSMGPSAHRLGLRDWLFENPVHHFDLARHFFGELGDIHVARHSGTEHTVVVTASSESGAIVSIRANTTGSWEQRNEAVEIFGQGHSVLVENVDTCIWRPPGRPEHVWRPNYTVPTAANMTGSTMGFVSELAHFRAVLVDDAACESDLASAAATLRLTRRIAELALAD